MRYVMLRDKKVVVTEDLNEWIKANEFPNKRVARTTLPSGNEIITDFFKCMVGMHDDLTGGFESMVFGGQLNGLRARFDTWEQAEAGHTLFCTEIQRVEDELKKNTEEGAK